ncbi:MAG: hypothetical protein LPH21_04800 [Shewanella sp.]|nr:hypothetical protein [Shewanella sp.]
MAGQILSYHETPQLTGYLCGCVAVWLCGCVAVWLCGCVASLLFHGL